MAYLRQLLGSLALGILTASTGLGCGGDETADLPPGLTDGAGGSDQTIACVEGEACAACSPGERFVGAICQPAGLPPDMPCQPGELLQADVCQPAGVPSDGCAAGFEHDGNGGCEATLPSARCPSGQMALMGETSCREVASCGSAPFGAIITSTTTQFVDKGYAAGASDGSQNKPWTTIQAGVDAAIEGATVAVAEGSYAEDVLIADKTLTLWARCPSLVELVGTGSAFSALSVFKGADNTLVRGLAIRGSGHGVIVSGSEGVVLEELWVHDLAGQGVHLEPTLGKAAATLKRSLIENTLDGGLVSLGSEAHVLASVVRSIKEGTSSRLAGVRFMSLRQGDLASGSIVGSLLEDNIQRGVLAEGADVRIDGSLIRGTRSRADGKSEGGAVSYEAIGGPRGKLTISRSVLDDNAGTGIYLQGSLLDIDSSVVAATLHDESGGWGLGVRVGMSAQNGLDAVQPSQMTMTSSLISGSARLGIFVGGSDVTMRGAIVRDTRGITEASGYGLQIDDNDAFGRRSDVTISGSVVADSAHAGLWVRGSDLEMSQSVVRDNAIDTLDGQGTGLVVSTRVETGERTQLTVRESLFDGNWGGGIVSWSADAHVRDCIIRNTRMSNEGTRGMGYSATQLRSEARGSTLDIAGVAFDDNHSIGLEVGGSEAAIVGCRISGTKSRGDGLYGRGITIQGWQETGTRSSGSISATLFEHNQGAGLYVGAASATITSSRISDTKINGAGTFGDGILVADMNGFPTALAVSDVFVGGNERAAIANFGSWIGLHQTAISCQPLDLNAEPVNETEGVFEDLGDNGCGCPEPTSTCRRVSAHLSPPQPEGPLVLKSQAADH